MSGILHRRDSQGSPKSDSPQTRELRPRSLIEKKPLVDVEIVHQNTSTGTPENQEIIFIGEDYEKRIKEIKKPEKEYLFPQDNIHLALEDRKLVEKTFDKSEVQQIIKGVEDESAKDLYLFLERPVFKVEKKYKEFQKITYDDSKFLQQNHAVDLDDRQREGNLKKVFTF